MPTRIFRITVRGFFDSLTAPQREHLLAESDEHDILRAQFTPEGHLAYDLTARDAFTFRILESGTDADGILSATDRAEAAATTWLTSKGYGFKNLRSQAVDLSQAPRSKRQRRTTA